MLLLKKVKENNRKKNSFLLSWSLVFITIPLILNVSIVQAQENKICTIETRGYPGRDPAMWDELYAANDGKVYSALISEGTSAHYDGPEGKITSLAKMCDSKFLEGDHKDIPYSTLAFAVDSRNRKVYFAPSARNYNTKKYVETFGSKEDQHLIMYDIKTNQRVDLGAMRTADGRKVFGCEAGISPRIVLGVLIIKHL